MQNRHTCHSYNEYRAHQQQNKAFPHRPNKGKSDIKCCSTGMCKATGTRTSEFQPVHLYQLFADRPLAIPVLDKTIPTTYTRASSGSSYDMAVTPRAVHLTSARGINTAN